jgi:hypothetical protein
MKMRLGGQIGTIVFLLGTPLLGRADILFSDYGSGDTYNTGNGWTVGMGVTLNLQPAAAFTPSVTDTLSEIDVSVGYLSGTNGVTVNLLNSVGGIPTGKPIESWTLTDLPSFGSSGQVETLDSAGPPVSLVHGKTYWLQVAPADGTTDASWYLSDSSVGSIYVANSGGPVYMVRTQDLPAFQILGPSVVVPEPAFFLPIGAAWVAMWVIRKRRYDPLRDC